MGRNETFEGFATVLFRRDTAPGQHRLEGFQKLLGHNQVLGVACVVKRNQYLVG